MFLSRFPKFFLTAILAGLGFGSSISTGQEQRPTPLGLLGFPQSGNAKQRSDFPLPSPADRTLPSDIQSTGGPITQSGLHPIEGGQKIAQIGSEVVLADDLLAGWNEFLAQNASQIPHDELERIRYMFMANRLRLLIQTKLIFADARRDIPPENFPRIEETIDMRFEETQLPKLYEQTKTHNRADLETKLKERGSSIDQQKRFFSETVLAMQWRNQKIKTKEEITHDELWSNYQEHLSEFEYEAQARWDEIMVRFDRFPSKKAAYQRLCELGNQVHFQPRSFANVAKQHSRGATAEQGGRYDWTTQGSLLSTAIDEAIFSLPIGELSPILEDTKGYRIVRVIERKEAGRTSFTDAQPGIRVRILKARKEQQFEKYLAKLRRTTPVWTIFDQEQSKQEIPTQIGQRPDVPQQR